MTQQLLPLSPETRSAVSALFDKAPAVMVEVRFPGCATSPDWYLCDEQEQLDKVLACLAEGAEIRLSNVEDLRNAKGAFCFRK
jgi:hypothetical protein